MTDYSIYADFLARLQATTSEEEKSWMLMEFSLNQLSPAVREAVWAAAIPRQFDEPFLDALLETNLTTEELKTLLSQSYIEHLWGGGYAVHESTRKLLLAKFYQNDLQCYRKLNLQAAKYCEQQNQDKLRWKVATLYHQVLADLDGIEVDFYNQASDWWNVGTQRDKIEALIRPMLEEVTAHRVGEKIIARTYHWQGVLDSFYGRPISAKNYLKQAVQLFQQLADQLDEAESIFRLGTVHSSLSEYEAARTAYQQALYLFQQIGSKLGEANCIQGLGDVHLRLSDYEAARTAYQQALPLYQQIGDKLGEANCIQGLGDVHLSLSDYEAARTAYQQALPLFQQIGDKLGEADCIQRLGNVHLSLSDYEATRTAYQQALPLFQQIGDKHNEAYCVGQLSQVLAEQEQIDEAIHTLQHAAELYHAIGAVVGEAGCFDRIANVYHNQKRYEESLAAYQHAIDIAPDGGYWYHNRAHTYIAMEKYDLALQDIERAEKTGIYLEYLQKHRGMIALWQQQPQTAVELLQHATQQRPKDGSFQCSLALALLANGNAEAFATMETGLKLTYRKKTVERTLEELDKLVRIYGERAEFAQMRTLLTQELMQRFEMPSESASS